MNASLKTEEGALHNKPLVSNTYKLFFDVPFQAF